jgi:hypothetical protein
MLRFREPSVKPFLTRVGLILDEDVWVWVAELEVMPCT